VKSVVHFSGDGRPPSLERMTIIFCTKTDLEVLDAGLKTCNCSRLH